MKFNVIKQDNFDLEDTIFKNLGTMLLPPRKYNKAKIE